MEQQKARSQQRNGSGIALTVALRAFYGQTVSLLYNIILFSSETFAPGSSGNYWNIFEIYNLGWEVETLG